MDANQLAEGLARAVEMAKPAQEYCFLWFWTNWWPMCMTKAEWSGWVQAIGSILAIVGSGWFVRQQISAARAQDVIQHRRRLSAFQVVFQSAHDLAVEAVDASESPEAAQAYFEFTHSAKTFVDVRASLNEIGVAQMESSSGTEALLEMRRAVDQAEHLVKYVCDCGDDFWAAADPDEVEAFRRELRNALSGALKKFQNASQLKSS